MPSVDEPTTHRKNGKRSGGNSPTLPRNVKATTETMVRAAHLRAQGATFREIGEALNIDHTWARTLVLKALTAAQYEAADMMRIQEGLRLDRMQVGLWGKAIDGDTKAVTAVIRIMERRARLFGLDSAIQVEVNDTIDREIVELADRLGVEAPKVLEAHPDQ